jgi:hypothetical protein
MNMINLLPPQYKARIREAKKIRVAVNIGILIILSSIIFWLSLVIINTRLGFMKESQTFSVVQEKAKVSQLEKIKGEMGKVNSMIIEINKFYAGQIVVSDLLIHLSNILGKEVELDNFSFDKISRKVVITGTVKSLAGLNALKDVLNNQETFKAVSLAIPSYIPKEDITFKTEFIYE